MSRVEDFSAGLESPEVFRDICLVLASIGRVCFLSTQRAADEPESVLAGSGADDAGDEEELVLSTSNPNNSFHMWVHLSSRIMFNSFELANPEWLELKTDSLAHAFRNTPGLLSMSDVHLRISHKTARQHSTYGSASQVMPQASRLISVKMENRARDGISTKAIEQRVYAELVEPDLVLAEPSLEGVELWADPTLAQLRHMAKVCDQYRQMSDIVQVTISRAGLMTLVSVAQDVVASTSWRIELAERTDEEGTAEASAGEDLEEGEKPLFIDESDADSEARRMRQERIRARNSATCSVSARDWYTILQARKMCRRVIIGVSQDRGLVVYGFLWQGRSLSSQDVATFYLWHQG